MAIIKNTTVTGALSVAAGPSNLRSAVTPTVVNFTTVGSGTWSVPAGVYNLQVLVVAGGGASGYDVSSGGGAGGLVYRSNYAVTPGDSISYTVGAGGATGSGLGGNGGDSVFGTIRAYGGGGGAYYYDCQGRDGGSGGGGNSTGPNSSSRYTSAVRGGGRGVAGQGYPGGGAPGVGLVTGSYGGGGGGGAGGPGSDNIGYGAAGGNGLPFSISGTTRWYAGGGAAGASNYSARGGLGGGGDGNTRTAIPGLRIDGDPNTGGGGGGSAGFTQGAGGSGIIIVSYVLDTSVGQLRYNTEGQTLETSDVTGWKSLPSKSNNGSSNALTYNTDLTNAYWTKENVTLTSGQTAPDGSSTAYTMTENSSTGDHRLYALPAIGAGGQGFFVAQIYVKYTSSLQYFLIRHSGVAGYNGAGTGTAYYCYFDLLNRKVTESIGGAIGEIFPEANGWLRLRVTYHYGYLNSNYSDVVFAMSTVGTGGTTNPTYAGNGSRNVQIWKPELLTATDIEANGYKTHIYRNLGGNQYFTPDFTGNVEVLVVGGGGGGASTYDGNNNGNGPRGGGGGGGVLYNANYAVTAGTMYPVTVGAGGAGGRGNNVDGNQGGDSRFGNIYSLGGGAGQRYNSGSTGNYGNGGSGGGVAYSSYSTGCQPGAGNMGGGNVGISNDGAAGGGGAGGPGAPDMSGGSGGNGGPGIGYSIAGRLMPYGGGGGAGGYPAGRDNYGLGGGLATGPYLQNNAFGMGGQSGGRGGQGQSQSSSIAAPSKGVDYTGGGGGGGGSGAIGADGGHGIVIVRYQAPTKCAMFLQSGTWICPPGVTRARVLVVAGGGGGGQDMGGGGGAGGLLYNDSYPVEAGKAYSVTIGAGGRGAQSRDRASERGQNGGNSVFGNMTAIGGGGGASFHDVSSYPASSGGSGGGASGGAQSPSGGSAGAGGYGGGAAASGTAGQGNNGSFGIYAWYPGGGGGAGAAGRNDPASGGIGLPFNLLGPMLYFAGGGAGSGYSSYGGNGGMGGGAGGAVGNETSYTVGYQHGGGWSLNWGDRGNIGKPGWQSNVQGANAGQNTGGGGGGGGHYNVNNAGGHGADGIVIIKWD